jgi:hypothetical protein
LPSAVFYGVQPGESYRIASTMRQISGDNPTRRLTVETMKPQVIR